MHDLSFALRQIARRIGFASLAVATLAVGIALVAVQYSLIDGLLVRPLPFPESARMHHLAREGSAEGGGWQVMGYDEFSYLRERQQAFDELVPLHFLAMNLVHDGGPPQRLVGFVVGADFFTLLRAAPARGRAFLPGEDRPGQPLLAVISDALWRDSFGAAADIVGRSVMLNGESAEIIGVMPPGFGFISQSDVWTNLRLDPLQRPAWDTPGVQAVGLLRNGLDPAEAVAQLNPLIAEHLRRQGADESMARLRVEHLQRAFSGGDGVLFAVMLAMTGFVLALACVNVANLLFVRAAERGRELALRSALGAGRGRVVRQLMVESLLLAALGALLGIALSAGGIHLLDRVAHARIALPGWIYFDLNARVLSIIIGSALLAGLAAGLLPALRASRLDPVQALREEGGSAHAMGGGRSRGVLVAGQFAFAAGAMVVSTLLALSALHNSRANLGFDPDSLLVGRIELQAPAYATPESRAGFYARLLDTLRETPGVAAVAVSSRDLVGAGVWATLALEGVAYPRDVDRPQAWLEVVSREYFEVVDKQALRGRLFAASDRAETPPVALVNQSLAERLWPGQDPIGQRLRRHEADAPWATVVGVVPDLNMAGVSSGNASGAGWYLLQDQQAWGWLDLLVRAEGDAQALVPTLREAVTRVDPAQPVHAIATLAERTRQRVAGLEIIGQMALVFAAAALLLAAVGIYGVMAFAARRRTRELGLRMALGATRGGILGLMLRLGATQSLGGIALGLLFGFGLSRPLAPLLPPAVAGDVRVYLLVAALLVAAAFAASWWPARRAARLDPMEALRAR